MHKNMMYNVCNVAIQNVNLFVSAPVSSPAQCPSFRSEPASLVQSRGSVAHLRCLVSPPSALVSWRFRGRPLDKDTLPGLEINEGSLTISSLKPSHVGVYQCVARSDSGPAIASRLARVAIAGTDARITLLCILLLSSKQRCKEREEVALRKGRPLCVTRMPVLGCLLLSGGGGGSSSFYSGTLPDAS